MKSPEEIKKGLENCANGSCRDCRYEVECMLTNGDGKTKCMLDALAYIQQLEELASSRLRRMKLFRERANKYIKEYLQLRNRVEKLEEQMPKWIRVEAQLPADDAAYLCHFCDGQDVVCIYFGHGEWITMDCDNVTQLVTHWMPLPEPPKEEEHE